MDNPESYFKLFQEHTEKLAKLMKILDESIIHADLPPVGRSKDLFRMVLDISYQVDRAYKREHNIEEPEYAISTLISREKYKEEMRGVFVEEFNRFLSQQK